MAASQSNRKTTTANRRKTTGSKSRNTKKTTASRGRNTKKTAVQSGVRDEMIVVIALGIAILMALSTFNLCGTIGYYISYFIFGIFGWLAYLFPYLLFLGAAFYVSNRNNKIAKLKISAAVIICIAMMALIQMFTDTYDGIIKITDYYHDSAVYKHAGGIIGGSLVHLLRPAFGVAGAYVIILLILIIGIILITEKAVFASLGRKSRQAYTSMANTHRERKEIREENRIREQEQEEERQEKLRLKKLESEHNLVIPKEDKSNYDTADLKLEPKDDFEITVTHMEPIKVDDTQDLNIAEVHIPPVKKNADIAVTEPIGELPFDTDTFSEGLLQEQDIADMSADFAPEERFFDAPKAETRAKREPKAQEAAEPISEAEIAVPLKEYVFPPVELLKRGKTAGSAVTTDRYLKETALKLQSTLDSFGVKVQVTNVSCGPSVTRYELQPEQGVKVSKIVSLSDDIKLNLAVADIRIEAPIPGKAAVGIEVPNKENTTVMLRDLLEAPEFKAHKSDIAFAAGRDIGGQVIVADIAKMPHLLIAGATGSGKSVCINTLIMSIIYKAKPEDVRLIMIDPKVVELSVYNGIPHLMIPVVTDPKKAAGALNWAVVEMTERYKKFAELNVRDLKGYNEKIAKSEYESEDYKRLPQIVIIVDELADLMMVAPGEVEDAICRLAQLARAAGLHLVIATQRPSVNVITGLIKANVPSRIAFSVSSGVDSRTIIDMNGAEKLLGKGDMLFYPAGHQKPQRVQGAFVSDKEVNDVVEFLKAQALAPEYNEEITNHVVTPKGGNGGSEAANDRDQYFIEAGKFIIDKDKASIGMLQRVYKIGFNRAARIMDQLCEAGVVGPEEGTKPRKVLMSPEEFEQFIDECV